MHRANNFERRIINSRVFKFIVGETIDGIPTEFSIYEEAIAQLSKPLHNLVKGGLSEAQAGCTIWKDVSKETFERFVQVAYTGDYSIPNTREWNRVAELGKARTDALVRPASLSTSEELKESEPEGEKAAKEYDSIDELRRSWRTSKKVKKDNKKGKETKAGLVDRAAAFSEPVEDPEPKPPPESGSVFRTRRDRYPDPPSPPPPPLPRLFAADFHSLQYPLPVSRNIHHHTCEPAEHFEPDRSYSNVFLAHASLYVLGDFWLIDSLKALALYKLHKTLCIFQLDDENIEDIVDLARYAYNEEGKGLEEGIGRLRGMVCQYMALNAAVLSLHAGFTDLLADGGQFVKDFFQFALQRMQ